MLPILGANADYPQHLTRPLRVLVACECSGVVRDAFLARGFDAWSCDLLPCEGDPARHIHGDAIKAAYSLQWDLLIAHPECTFMANSGAKHLYAGMKKESGPNPDRWAHLGAAASFFLTLWNAPVRHKAFENPIMLGHVKRLFPDFPEVTQIVQPHWFGHGETKATGLYLDELPPLVATNHVEGREQRIWKMGPGPDRKRERSRTFTGIAAAMAEQWGDYIRAQRARKAA